jgi:hypothetical protein
MLAHSASKDALIHDSLSMGGGGTFIGKTKKSKLSIVSSSIVDVNPFS